MIKADEEINEMDMETPFVYIFVREDLPPVQQVIQAAHVAHESGIEFGKIDGKVSHFCIFGVRDEEELKSIRESLAYANKVKFHCFYEPDFDMGYSAMATEPLVGESRERFKTFNLLRMKNPWF